MMELQWPLILFTTLVAWSAGLFGTQALMAVFGVGKKAQVPAWVCSAVLLAAGGIAVFFHLEHWERIFNGFGHLTSGITQELIAIVVLAVVAIVYLVLMRKSDDGASVPKWLAWVSVALSVVLVAVMAHSYTMAARPAWDSALWILYVLGNACVLGPATFAPGPARRARSRRRGPRGSRGPRRRRPQRPRGPRLRRLPPALRRLLRRRRPLLRPDAPHEGHGRRRRDGRLPGPAAVAGRRGRGRDRAPGRRLPRQAHGELEALGPGRDSRRPGRRRLHARRLLQPGALGLHVLLARPPIAPAGAPPTRRAPPQAQEGGSPPRPSSPVRGNAECFT